METIIRTCQGDPPSFDTYAPSIRTPSRAFKSWIKMVLKKNPEQRPSIANVLNHHFLSSMDDDEDVALLKRFVACIPDLDAVEPAEVVPAESEEKDIQYPKWRYE